MRVAEKSSFLSVHANAIITGFGTVTSYHSRSCRFLCEPRLPILTVSFISTPVPPRQLSIRNLFSTHFEVVPSSTSSERCFFHLRLAQSCVLLLVRLCFCGYLSLPSLIVIYSCRGIRFFDCWFFVLVYSFAICLVIHIVIGPVCLLVRLY